MRENRTPGSARGTPSNRRSYLNRLKTMSLLKSLLLISMVLVTGRTHSSESVSQVTVNVDCSKSVWKVTVTNFGSTPIAYEMLEKVPRGLGIEFWFGDVGYEIHADNLAELLSTHGFPADMRAIEPGGNAVFHLNPKKMSAEKPESLKIWEREFDLGFNDFRVFFGDFASPRIRHSPLDKTKPNDNLGEQGEPPKP